MPTINGNLKINDLRDLMPILRKRKWLILLPWVIVSAIIIGGSFFITPEYQAFSIVQLNKDVKLSTELQGLLGIGRAQQTSEQRREELRGYYNELTSSWYISQMATRLKLDQDPELSRRAQKAVNQATGMTLDQARLLLLQGQLQQKINVTYAGGDQIQITAESTSPAQARDMANALSDIFISEKLKQELSSIRSSQDFSDVQLQKYEKLLEDKIDEKTEFERNYLRNQLDGAITSDSNRTQIQGEIDQTQSDLNDQQTRERSLLSRLNGTEGLSAASLTLKDSEDNRRAKADLKELLRSVSELMTKYTWRDPQILNNRLRQNSLLGGIEIENKRLVTAQYENVSESTRALLTELFTTRASLDYFTAKREFLKSTLDQIKDQVNRLPEYQATIDRLDREIQSATDLRDKFKKQQEGTTISQALLQDMSSSKYRVVEPAKLPMIPFKPDRVKIIFIGIVLGLVIGCAAAVVMELLDSSFKKVEDLEQFIGLPVLGVTPKIEFLSKFKKQIA
ncbi:MAG: GNVR domain-containing protein [Candidatus Zixiibacteriota bacterium]